MNDDYRKIKRKVEQRIMITLLGSIYWASGRKKKKPRKKNEESIKKENKSITDTEEKST